MPSSIVPLAPQDRSLDPGRRLGSLRYGWVTGTWDPGTGEVATRGDSELLLARVDQATATVDHAGSIGGTTGFPYPGDVAPTFDGGAVYTGWSSVGIDLDPGPGGQLHVPSGGKADAFALKVDGEGTLAWSAVFEGTARIEIYDVGASPDGRVVVAGWVLTGDVDLDPGPGTDVQTASGYDGWVASLDADGALEWAGRFAAEAWPVSGGATADADDRNDAFVVKLDPAGEVLWLAQLGGAPNTLPYGAQLDVDRVLWLSGYFDGETDFDVVTLGGDEPEVSCSVAVANTGHFMLDGQYTGPTDWHPGAHGSGALDGLRGPLGSRRRARLGGGVAAAHQRSDFRAPPGPGSDPCR